MLPRDLVALATDYDRTLTTEDLGPVPELHQAMSDARERGLRIVVVSGREMPFLESVVGDAADALVAENGCLWKLAGGETLRTHPRLGDVRKAMEGLDVETEFGEVLASVDIAHRARIVDHFAASGYEADLVPNRDRLMVLPRGVDKAVGVLAALDKMGIDPRRCAAVGDGENDLPMLRAVGLGLAVANAVPELKAAADHVLPLPGGHGVAQWLASWRPSQEARA